MARNEEGMKRERKISILVVFLSVLAIAAPRPSTAQQPIRIGASIAITGRDQVQGGYVREGYLLCQKHVNEKGVLGRTIEFLIRDDGSDPKAAVGLYEKLITEDTTRWRPASRDSRCRHGAGGNALAHNVASLGTDATNAVDLETADNNPLQVSRQTAGASR